MTNPPQTPPPAYGHPGAARPPYPPAYAPAAPARARNVPGLIAFIAGLALLGMQLLWTAVQAFALRDGGYDVIAVLNAVSGVVNGLFALVAVVFGLIAVLQKGRPHALGGIGLGLGLAALVGVVSGFVIYPLMSLL